MLFRLRFVVTMITILTNFLRLLALMIFIPRSWIVLILVLLHSVPVLMPWPLLVSPMVPVVNGLQMAERSGCHDQQPPYDDLMRAIKLTDRTLRAWL